MSDRKSSDATLRELLKAVRYSDFPVDADLAEQEIIAMFTRSTEERGELAEGMPETLEKHRVKPEWYRRGQSLAMRILDHEWQSKEDRRATLVVEVACDIRDAVEEALRVAPSSTESIERRAIAWANNSLFGSHGFFLSLNGGEPDEHHLDRHIEELKAACNRWYQAAQPYGTPEALKEALSAMERSDLQAILSEIEALRRGIGVSHSDDPLPRLKKYLERL